MKKISKRAHIPHVSGGNGYQWDNGVIAFGDPMDVTKRKEFLRQYDKDYRDNKKTKP